MRAPVCNRRHRKYALVDRGLCSFGIKAQNAQAAGAAGLIVANNAAGTLLMGCTTDPTLDCDAITIPAGLILQAGCQYVLEPNLPFDASWDNLMTVVPSPAVADTVSSFSSRGPGRENYLKPDITAPGDAITSTANGTGTGAATFGGTSMASPTWRVSWP